jgi:hypothetical protein
MSELFALLAAPFDPDKVSWRVGTSNKKKRQRETGDNSAKATKGQVLAYIDARDVMDRLDEVCTPGGWQNRYTHADKKTICEIGILINGEWVWKADGAGESDIEAEKGALSDAFKRAAVRWGIGRYLYHLPTPWVDLDEREQIPDGERRRLEALLQRAGSPPRHAPRADEPSGIFIAAKAAIDICGTDEDALNAWKADNEAAFQKMDEADLTAVKRYWQTRVKAARDAAKAAPTKRDDFGLNGDEVPTFN